ncbi:hypothetical protein I3843_01G190800 [Carya illinoinensis]|nr:hypothetical protein I3843_01G190800 [Carya illinoinensis]
MPSKRSRNARIVRPSSQGDTGLLGHVQPIESSEDLCLKKRAINGRPKPAPNPVAKKSNSCPLLKQKQVQPLKSVLTLGSPTICDDEGSKNKKPADEGFGDFLKACSLCKKKLLVEKDVYMYGYLNAFCSAECRDYRIALDGFEKQVSLESTKLIDDGTMGKTRSSGRGLSLKAKPNAAIVVNLPNIADRLGAHAAV